MKKKLLCFAVMLCMAFSSVACADHSPVDGGEIGESKKQAEQQDQKSEVSKMYITVNDNTLEVTTEKNTSVDALVELLKKGDITYTANDYGSFEKVGNIGHSLPRNDSRISAKAGDVMLYQGNQLVLFYGENSWSYTKIGRINGYEVDQLKKLIGAGSGSEQVTISLNK